jgi:hypothetical protein
MKVVELTVLESVHFCIQMALAVKGDTMAVLKLQNSNLMD